MGCYTISHFYSLLNHPFVSKKESNGSKTMARWQLSSYVISNQIQYKTKQLIWIDLIPKNDVYGQESDL